MVQMLSTLVGTSDPPHRAPRRYFPSLHHSLTAPPPGAPFHFAPAKSVVQPEPDPLGAPSLLHPFSSWSGVPEPCASLQTVNAVEPDTLQHRRVGTGSPLPTGARSNNREALLRSCDF